MIELKTPREIEEMKPAGRFVGGILKELQETTKVGTNLLEIDEFVHKKIVDRKGAESCYVDYAPDFGTGPFAHYICTSVNDAVLHGVPYDYSLKDGDLVSLDLAISVDGWVADSAVSFVVGKDPDPEDLRIIKCTEEALAAAIDVAKPGNRLGDISNTIGDVARELHFMSNDDHGGVLVGERTDDAQDLAGQLGVERRGRLVKAQDIRRHGERTRDGDALLLAAGELVRIMAHAALEAHPGK